MDNRVLRVNSLIIKIQKGDEKALDALFIEFGALFLCMAKKYLFEKGYAEDLLSEMFLELWRSGTKSFNAKFNGLNWIFTIIRNKAYKYNGLNHNTVPLEEIENQRSFSQIISQNDEDSDKLIDDILLKDALQSLSNYENELLYYKYWESLTIREIAIKLHKPRSTIHYDIKTILNKLKKILD